MADGKSVSKKRSVGQYLFDVIVKTILCASVISVDFTLFANSGNYDLFFTSPFGNLEAIYIYVGIAVVSFILMFIASFVRPLENITLSAVFALFVVAVINQFAAFDKKSGLLLIFDGVFSYDVNIILYQHAHMIMSIIVFLIVWIILSFLNRRFMLCITLGVCAVLGWLISEAYMHPDIKYFNEVAGLPNLKKENVGENIIFLSFNDLTSINNLKNMNDGKQKIEALDKAYKNAVGFYKTNNFTLYPNALVEHSDDAFLNLILSYNADDLNKKAKDVVSESINIDNYFNFKSVQPEKIYLRTNGLYEMLRKKDYKINVFQTRGADTCYVDNELIASSCNEKMNLPITLTGEHDTTFDKLVVLLSQWIESTGLVSSVNPLLKILEYAGDFIPNEFQPKNVVLSKVYSYNSTKIFDKLIETIDKLSGNQAYFAVIDLPSDNFVYDEFCNIKPLANWSGAKKSDYSKESISDRKRAYAEQLNCLYGSLQKFMNQLEAMGLLENTTIIIQGLNNPLDLSSKQLEYYKQIQNKRQVTFAIKKTDGEPEDIDYSVCSVPEIINSVFFSKKNCKNFDVLKTSDKNIESIKKTISDEKLSDSDIESSVKSFNDWYASWSTANDLITTYSPKDLKDEYIEKASLTDKLIEDIPEEKLKSIKSAMDEVVEEAKKIENVASEAIDDVTEKTEKVVKDGKENVEKASEKIVEKSSKMDELAKKTFEEISAKVDSIAKQKDKKENIIDKVNSATQELSSDINKKIKNVTEKVADVLEKTDVEGVKKQDNEITKEIIAKDVGVAEDMVDEKVISSEEDIVTRIKRAIKEKEELINKEQMIDLKQEVEEKIAKQSESLREILEAPVAEGQDLSPEELKKIYRNKIKKAIKNSSVQLEIIER